MSFTNIDQENTRLTAANAILSRALGTAISLLNAIIGCKDWVDFQRVRDEIKPHVSRMTGELQSHPGPQKR